MNAYYALWMERLTIQSRLTLIVVSLAAFGVLAVRYAPKRRLGVLRLAALGYVSVFILVVTEAWGKARLVPSGGVVIHRPLWYDETFTALVAGLPFGRMLAAVAGDVHPPLWYIVEWAIVRVLGRSEIALRLPALMLGVASVWLTWRVARTLGFRRATATLAVVLLALLPGQVYYAQEARMYTLLQAAVLLAVLGIVSRRRWVMIVGMITALYTHNLGAVYVAVLAALYLWAEGALKTWMLMTGEIKYPRMAARMLAGWLAPLAGVAALYVPWVIMLAGQVGHVSDGFWIPDYDIGGYLSEILRVVLMGAPSVMVVNLVMIVTGLMSLVVWRWMTQKTAALIIPAALAFAPPVILALASEVWRPVFLHRALLPSVPFLALAGAEALDALSPQCRRVILAVTLVTLLASLGFLSKDSGEMLVWTADQVRDRCETSAVWHASLASYITMTYYLPECEHAVWPDAGNLSQALTLPTQRAMGIKRVSPELVEGDDLTVVWVENPTTTDGELDALESALSTGTATLLASKEHDLMKLHIYSVTDRSSGQGQGEGAR